MGTKRRLAAVVTLALACGSCSATTAAPDGGAAVPVPAEGAYFGTHFSASLPDRRQRLEALEDQLGRGFAVDHTYYQWDDVFPTDYDRWTLRSGRIPFLNWTTRSSDGPPVKFSDIISGDLDAVIDARAREVADLGRPVFVAFAHEPGPLIGDSPSTSGTEEEYVEAWRHVVSRFDAEGADNVSWVWTLTAFAFKNGDQDTLYPGDDVVDWVGVDGYVNVRCPWLDVPWTRWAEVFTPAHDFAASRDKPLMVAEFGLREDPSDPARKAEWLSESVEDIKDMPSLKAVVSFNSQSSCSSPVVSSQQALRGYRTMGQDPWLRAGIRRGGQ
jgi:hypothetical protein